uniref:Uncharacterized protein n=1 Tax=Oryza brachyantha TaxID=4533 RepID=J3LD61_ORYBR
MAPAGGGQAAAPIEAARRAAAPALTSGMVRSKPRKPRSRRMSGGAPRKKAEMWSAHEHSQFLRGLEKCGKGKWKTMAREFVKTKSPIQIASHYQKFCIREESRRLNQCKRTSIHDITEPTTPAPETTPAAATAAVVNFGTGNDLAFQRRYQAIN